MDSGLSLIEVTASAARTKPTLVGAAGVVPDGVGKLLDLDRAMRRLELGADGQQQVEEAMP